MDEHQGETDGETAELAVGMTAVGDAEDDHQEHEGQQSLNEESTPHVNGSIHRSTCVRINGTSGFLESSIKAVGCKHASVTITSGFPNHEQQSTGDDTTDKLSQPVNDHLFKGHATIDEDTETHGWVQVSTRDVTDAISHGYHGKTKSDSYAQETNVSKQSSTATTENKNECAE